MLTALRLEKFDVLWLREVLRTKNATHLSILSSGTDILFVCSSPEFSKLYVYDNTEHATSRTINYRIPVEIVNLLLLSDKLSLDELHPGLHLVLEEVITPDSESAELLVYLKIIPKPERSNLLLRNKLEPTPSSAAFGNTGTSETFRIAIGMDYNFVAMLRWYKALYSNNVEKHQLNMGASMKFLVEVSRIFRTGIYIKDGLAYADSSKTGVELYRELNYSGPEMMVSHNCITTLADFAKNTNTDLSIFRCDEYMLASTQDNVVMVWKNIRFNLEPNIDDLRKASYHSVYECELKTIARIFNTISVNKANQIHLSVDFVTGNLVVRDAMKGKYSFRIDFECVRGNYDEDGTAVKLNFRVLKNIFSVRAEYNKVRFIIYPRFVRIDLINKIGEDSEDGEVYYDSANKMVLVIGRGT